MKPTLGHGMEEYIRARFSYDPESGVLSRDWKSTHRTKLGPVTRIDGCGYVVCKVGTVKYSAHRIVWLLAYGVWPTGQVDHINGNRSDNRLSNLRDVTNAQNQWNSAIQKNNKAGYKGVKKTKSGKFSAQIISQRKITYLGVFDTAKEAHKAYCLRAQELFGPYANSGFGPIASEATP